MAYNEGEEARQRGDAFSWRTRFDRFVKNQEKYRFLWMIVPVVGECCVLTPGVLAIIFYSNSGLVPLLFCVASVMVVFVTNLAAMPLKITLPALALSFLTDALIVLFCLVRLVF